MGIYVGGTGSANHLDDYEEGTWDPAVKGGTTAGSYNATGEGFYIKTGRQVFCWLNCKGTTSGASGQTQIHGLPFTAAANNAANGETAVYSAGSCQYWSGYGSSDILGALVPTGNTIVYFHCDNGSSTGNNLDINNSNHNAHVFVCYFTD
tara:strand:- start:45 stop:494 length:450 start_codon:yes stop_codon:yes gene_type:complete